MGQTDFQPIFERMKAILSPYAAHMGTVREEPQEYLLETVYSRSWRKPLFFASAAIKKNYVSFYLMPVYMHPELLEGITPELSKRMQGKSCFNLKSLDEALLAELKMLTEKGYKKFIEAGDID